MGWEGMDVIKRWVWGVLEYFGIFTWVIWIVGLTGCDGLRSLASSVTWYYFGWFTVVDCVGVLS